MKFSSLPSIAVLLLALFTLVPVVPAQQAAFNQGVELYKQGKYAEAIPYFEMVLRQKPGYVYARSYISRCKTAIAAGKANQKDLEAELAQIRIPQISFEDAPLGDVLAYLSKRTEEISQAKTSVNFIFKGTAEQRETILITLNVRNVPLTEAIRYVGQLSRCRVRYEDHAVVIDPNMSTPAPAVDPEPKQSDGTIFGEKPYDPFANN